MGLALRVSRCGTAPRDSKKPRPAVDDDHCTVTDENGRVRHEFTADGPNQLWSTDIAEHKTSWIPAIGGEALSLRGQERVRQQDRQILDRPQDDVKPCRERVEQRRRDAR